MMFMRKKMTALVMSLAMMATLCAGCGDKKEETITTEATTTEASTEATTTETATVAEATASDSDSGEYLTGNEGIYEGEHFIVGMSVGYTNFEEYDATTGEPVGLDIDILNYMADDLGFTYEISDMKLPQVVAGLQAEQLDFSISGMYETEERTKVIDMSESYLTAKSAMLIRAEDADTIKSTADLNGKTVCCDVGEAYYESVLPTIEGATVVEFDDNASCIMAVLGGQADARIIDGGGAKNVCEEYEGQLTYFMLDDSMIPGIDGNHYSMGFVKGSPMKAVFDAEIEKMKKNGELKKIIDQWLGEGMYDFD